MLIGIRILKYPENRLLIIDKDDDILYTDYAGRFKEYEGDSSRQITSHVWVSRKALNIAGIGYFQSIETYTQAGNDCESSTS